MSDIVSVSIAREPHAQFGFDLPERGIHLVPAKTNATAKDDRAVGRDAAGSVLPHAVLRDFGQFVLVPKEYLSGKTQKSLDLIFEITYAKLSEAISNEDAKAVDAVSLDVLARHPITAFAKLPSLHKRAFRYFSVVGCSSGSAELGRFMATLNKEELATFLEGSGEQVDILKGQILAAMAQGKLGDAPYNLIDMMKYLIGLQIAAIWQLRGDFSKDRPVPVNLLCQILEAPVFLPDFMFFDPCHWNEGNGGGRPIGAVGATVAKKRDYLARVAAKREGAQKNDSEPTTDDCECTCEHICLPLDPSCADINYFVSDTLVLRDATKCYLPGDLAYIENVAPRELRVRTHEFMTTIDDYSEEEITTTQTETRDHQVTDRSSVQNEIEKDIAASLDVQARYGGKKTYVKADAHLSRDVSQRETREKFREAVDKAVSTLQTTKRKLTSRRVTTQETETNTHTFDNTSSEKSAIAKYFYVNREVEGQVYSHGLAGQIDMLVPVPAALYKHLQKLKDEGAFDLKKPLKPGIKIKDIKAGERLDYMQDHGLYDLSVPAETPPVLKENHTLTAEKPNNAGKKWTFTYPITVPEGYHASSIRITSGTLNPANKIEDRYAAVTFGSATLREAIGKNNGYSDDHGPKSIDVPEGTSNLTVVCLAQQTPDVKIEVTFSPNPVDISEWQIEVYQGIIANYQKDLDAYNAALAEHKRRLEDQKFNEHPFTLKEIILAELKRAAIYMMCEDFERDAVMNMKSEPCGYPEINRGVADAQMWDQYFWDRAFDWEHMSFIFFDYFWNSMCEWADTFNPDHDNQMFKAFLRAGYARVMIPCAAGMELDVLWYTKTRQKWGPGGTIPLDPSDARWNSVVAELKHSKGCFQNDREGRLTAILDTTVVPAVATHQMLLQGSSLYWDILQNGPDNMGTIAADLNREIYIDGVAYKIQAINLLPSSDPLFDPSLPANEQWIITLERPFEGAAEQDGDGAVYPSHAFGIGALFVGAPFRWQEPTSLIWIGDQRDTCLPCYPVKCE